MYASGSIMKRGHATGVKASGAETASTAHTPFDTLESGSVMVTVTVTAVSGTSPTMNLVVEGSDDSSTWFTIGIIGANGYSVGSVATAPTNFTAAATTRGVFAAPQYVRTRSVIAGTSPSFTYSVQAAIA